MAALAAAPGASAAPAPAPQAVSVPAAFKNLVKILAHMFYGGPCPPPWWVDAADPRKPEEKDPELAIFEPEKKAAQLAREAKKKAQADTTGLAIVLLTALTDVQWVEEDDFARSLSLPPKMVRRAMRFFEQEQLVQREHRKETVRHRKLERNLLAQAGLRPAKGAAAAAAAAAAAGPGAAALAPPEEDDSIVSKGHIISYCCLDYPRIVDSLRWRIATVKRNLQKEIRNSSAVQQYKCPHPACGKTYSSMDVFELMPSAAAAAAGPGAAGRQLACGICGTEIVMVLDDGGKELGSMQDKKERQRKARALLESYDAALGPLTRQLSAVEGLTPPDFNTYASWLGHQVATRQRLDALAAQAQAAGAGGARGKASSAAFDANMQVVLNFADRSSSGGLGSPPGVAGSGAAGAGAGTAAAGAAGGAAPKPLPPWMVKQPAAQQAPAAAAKPIPPWLMSAQRQAAGGGGLQQQGAGPAGLGGLGLPGFKPEDGGSLKPDPGVKLEGFKLDPGLKDEPNAGLKQELGEDGDAWEDVAGDGIADGGDAGGGGDGADMGGGAAGMEEEDDWEDV